MAFIAWSDYVKDMTPASVSPAPGQFQVGDDYVTTDEENLETMRLGETCTFSTDSAGFVGQFMLGNQSDTSTWKEVGLVGLFGLKIVDTATGKEITDSYDLYVQLLGSDAITAISYNIPYTGVFKNSGIFVLPRISDSQMYDAYNAIISIGVGGTTKALTITLGRIWISEAWKLPSGIDARWETGIIDPGKMYFSDGHQGYAKSLQRYRELKASLMVKDFASAYGDSSDYTAPSLVDMYSAIGNTEEAVVVPRTIMTENNSLTINDYEAVKTGVYGTMKRIEPIRHISGGRFESGFTLRELL